jgi:molecular chaperone GrpE
MSDTVEKEPVQPGEGDEILDNTGDGNTSEQNVIDLLKAQLSEQQDKYLRLYAEFDNFKRRTAKEKIEINKTAGQEIIADLLPVLDDFERAENSIADTNDIESYVQGLLLIKEKLFRTMQNKGLRAMDDKGQPFNPDLHEAITEIPVTDKNLKGKVVDVVEKGYMLQDKIIRYAKVVVGK